MDISIDDVINTDLVTLELKATERDEAVREMAAMLAADGRVGDVDRYVAAVLEREEEGSTGMGMGIAIPHAKSDAVQQVGVAFARSDRGVDFGSEEEGADSRLLFLIAAPEGSGDLHVSLLAKLARRLVHGSFREGLTQASNADEVIDLLRKEVTL
jgi:fructose-specific phosphotransferase system IIA component